MTKLMLNKLKKLVRKIDCYSPYPLFFVFRMTANERRLFNKYIKTANYYLEYGSGGSTIRALEKSKAKVYSVESSLEWISILKEYKIINNSSGKRLFFHYVDIGKTKRYGFPKTIEARESYPKYSNSFFNTFQNTQIDTVLIDGRFRVACALSVIINISEKNNITILFHDFFEREWYHIVLKYLEIIDKTDQLAVFKIKENIDYGSVKKDFEIYKYIPN